MIFELIVEHIQKDKKLIKKLLEQGKKHIYNRKVFKVQRKNFLLGVEVDK